MTLYVALLLFALAAVVWSRQQALNGDMELSAMASMALAIGVIADDVVFRCTCNTVAAVLFWVSLFGIEREANGNETKQ